MRYSQKIEQSVGMHLRQAYQNPRVVSIVVGDEVCFRILGDEFFAAFEGHGQNNFVEILMKADEELSVDLQRWRSVGGSLRHVGQSEPQASDGLVRDLRLLQGYLRDSPRTASAKDTKVHEGTVGKTHTFACGLS